MSCIPDKTNTVSLLEIIKKQENIADLFPIHRIDKPVSGIILFAKNAVAAKFYSNLFAQNKIQKEYLAFTKKIETTEEIHLTHYIRKDSKARKAIISSEAKKGSKIAKLVFKVLFQSDHYSLLNIKISTGRFHQIRAQLSKAGIPIKGDVKYGARRKNNDRSIHLHAHKLVLPLEGASEGSIFTAPLPEDPLWDLAKSRLNDGAK
jgi:23S rRNA pseudouridine1911/1915/1917 synthase